MMHDEAGLPQTFQKAHGEGVIHPWDIKADAEELYSGRCLGDFDFGLLRGVVRLSRNDSIAAIHWTLNLCCCGFWLGEEGVRPFQTA